MQLDGLEKGRSARIVRVRGAGAFRKRILEMGFVQGKEVTMLGRAPLGDPYRFEVMGYCVTLRRDELKLIDVEPLDATQEEVHPHEELEMPIAEEEVAHEAMAKGEGTKARPSRTMRVALVGNPNSGKTSLFNYAAGAKEHTGNYSGVTIESKTAHFTHGDYTIAITDLPGTYSLTAYSPEERYVRSFITLEAPDVVINVIDTTNLERSLYLTLQLREMGVKVALALNMYDEFQEQGGRLNRLVLGDMLGVASTPTIGRTGLGIGKLLDSVVALHEQSDAPRTDVIGEYGDTVAEAIAAVSKALAPLAKVKNWTQEEVRYYALKALERDKEITQRFKAGALGAQALEAIASAANA